MLLNDKADLARRTLYIATELCRDLVDSKKAKKIMRLGRSATNLQRLDNALAEAEDAMDEIWNTIDDADLTLIGE
jgi:hypothetical protein